MVRRSLLVAFVLASALLAAPVARAASTSPAAPRTTSETGFKVEYRRAGAPAWTSAGTFKEMDKATAAAKGFWGDGYEVRVTKFEAITLHRPATGPAGKSEPPKATVVLRLPAGVSQVSLEKVKQVFAQMKAQQNIAYRYPIDGCYARAHLMGKLMQQQGLKPGKVWAFDDQAMEDKKAPPRLYAKTANHPKGEVWWKYHVAPALGVRDASGKLYIYVIDPSLFNEPVTVGRWRARMKHPKIGFSPRIDVTAWEQPPKKGDGGRFDGKGYWPGSDPSNVNAAAKTTMAMYKPLQGTDKSPPRPKTNPSAPIVKATPGLTTDPARPKLPPAAAPGSILEFLDKTATR